MVIMIRDPDDNAYLIWLYIPSTTVQIWSYYKLEESPYDYFMFTWENRGSVSTFYVFGMDGTVSYDELFSLSNS